MFDKLAGIETRYEEVDRMLADPAVLSDHTKITELAQERAGIEPIVEAYRQYKKASNELEEARTLSEAEADEEIRAMAQEETRTLAEKITYLESELKTLLLPKDPRDEKNVIVEIRAGTGGDEAGLCPGDVPRMDTRSSDGNSSTVRHSR